MKLIVSLLYPLEILQLVVSTHDAFRMFSSGWGDLTQVNDIGLLWFSVAMMDVLRKHFAVSLSVKKSHITSLQYVSILLCLENSLVEQKLLGPWINRHGAFHIIVSSTTLVALQMFQCEKASIVQGVTGICVAVLSHRAGIFSRCERFVFSLAARLTI